jgi:uncharacterized protein (TIGR03790 family)
VLAQPVGAAAPAGPAASAVPDAPASASAPRRGAPVPPPVQAVDLQPLAAPAPLVFGRLRAADLGLVINTRDPYSVAVGAHYAARRGLTESQILRVDLPVQPQLTPAQLEQLRQAIDQRFGFRAQALALAWVAPYAVLCNSLVGALALGLDEALCQNSCQASRPSPYANSRSTRPYSELRFRPAMHLAAADIDAAKALIDRGIKADGSLDPAAGVAGAAAGGLLGTPPGASAAAAGAATSAAVFVRTGDGPRNIRSRLYPNPQVKRWRGLVIQQVQGLAQVTDQPRILLQVGSATLQGLPEAGWLPGALADHLTSFGGDLLGGHGQATALRWIAAGATASHGAVSEPCNHLQKFPHPQWLMAHYAQGASAIEAYWKSVLWPQQSVFVGEPLAAPFAPAAVAR